MFRLLGTLANFLDPCEHLIEVNPLLLRGPDNCEEFPPLRDSDALAALGSPNQL